MTTRSPHTPASPVRHPLRFVALPLLAGAAVACSAAGAPAADTPVVVATIAPVADWCRVLLEDDARVHTLLRPGRTPHAYEPTPQDAMRITEASVVVGWGGAVDDWLAPLMSAAGATPAVVWLYVPPDVRPAAQIEARVHAEHAANPHTWLDPAQARLPVQRLAGGLVEALPEHAATIRERWRAFDRELVDLQARMARAAEAWQGGGVVTMHGGWPHFLAACGLRELGSIRRASGAPPSVRDLTRLTDALEGETIRVVIAEPQVSRALARTLAEERGAHVVVLDPLGRPGVPGYDTYLHMMHSNLDALAAVFGPIPSP